MHSQVFEGAYFFTANEWAYSAVHDKIKQTLLTSGELSVMPAKDAFHELVKIALETEGWTITHNTSTLSVFSHGNSISLLPTWPYTAK